MKKIRVIAFLIVLAACSDDNMMELEPTASLNISIEGQLSEEGERGSFSFTLDERLEQDLLINLSIEGSATNGLDYEEIESSILIPASTLNAKLTINPILDEFEEGDETVEIAITGTDNDNVTITIESAVLSLIDGPSREDKIRDETRFYMSNMNATDETVSLFYNLVGIGDTAFLIGQQDAFTHFYNDQGGDSDIKKSTGSDPALLGSDFMFITDDENNGSSSNWFYHQEQLIKSNALAAYQKGMVNAFSWHIREPYEGESFYTWEMTEFQKQNAFRSILPGGENHEYYKGKLQKVAEVLNSMVGSSGDPIPVIFRPFHEFDGSWFWWGEDYCTPEEFIQCWRFTVDYLTNDLQVNNVLFAFSPDNHYSSEAEYLERYPGDAYVDILGMDNYGDFINQSQTGLNNANAKIKIISDLAKSKGKISALTESCYFVEPGVTSPKPGFYSEDLLGVLTNNDVTPSFMMFWSNSRDIYCTPPPGDAAIDDFLEFVEVPETLLLEDIPPIYTITIPPES